MRKFPTTALTAVLLLFSFFASAQKTLIHSQPTALFEEANDLFAKEKYAAARHTYDQVIMMVGNRENPVSVEAEFYAAVCAYELMNKDAAGLFTNYIYNHPENSYVKLSWFYLGNIYYREKGYRKAIKAYPNTSEKVLSDEQLAEYHFKFGYSHFMQDDYTEARKHFMAIKDYDNKYTRPAIYYYSHIAYIEKQYEVALAGFKSLLTDESFGGIAPYYIAQIYYLQNKYDELIDFAPPMLENPNVKRQAEMSRMLGDAYYAKKRYSDAVPYLEKYMETTSKAITRDDYYQLGYAYYSLKNWGKAVENFEKVSSKEDSVNQNTSYHLADCYLQTGNKKYALNAFHEAYRLSFNKLISEDALFNYARLSYELDFHPYNGAVRALEQYLDDYPNSDRAEEAKELMVDLLMSTGNYKDAIEMIDRIKFKTERIREAYQKVNYYHGVEIYNSGHYRKAIKLFDVAITNNYNRVVRSEALYWKGEAYYHLNQYDSAAANYKLFLNYPAAEVLPYYNRAWYNMGYAQMQRKNYKSAQNSFKNYVDNSGKESVIMRNDAMLRLADCHFIQKDYTNAITWYDKSINLKSSNRDYALLQKAKCQGIKGNYNGKLNTLSLMMQNYPSSDFADDALYEQGITNEIMDKQNDALTSYDKIITDHNESQLRAKAILKKGMIYRNMRQNDDAIAAFKMLIDEYEGTEETKQAWMNLKAIYTDMDRIDDFIALVQDHGQTISQMEQDSLIYQAAENKYLDGDCESAKTAFKNYIENYPEGSFIVNAQFYRAECLYGENNFDDAISGYEFVLQKPFNRYTETSLLKSARIYFNKKNYSKSIDRYTKLIDVAQMQAAKQEARKNIMLSHYNLEQFNEAILAAQEFMAMSDITDDDKNKASAVIGRSAFHLGDENRATQEFQKLVKLKSNELGAEANYYLAMIQFNKKNYEESEKLIFDLINEFASFEYWVARSFILLSDVYVATGDLFQAKYTLQSVLDNYEGEDLKQEAQNKLDAILEMEKLEEQNSEGEGEIIINE
ncbi:MAG: hypothetical protein C0592_06000 [Marinilabiliales bacterium]|nr:MAG: hypothetical protein C0592_06000 [Marinilabiliales bacterium]